MSFEFTQPFDGTQPDVDTAEQQHVSSTFSSFIDEKLLEHIDMTHTTDASPHGESNPTTRLQLESSVSPVNITISAMPENPSLLKEIFLRKLNGVYGGDAVAYRLGHDNVVRRCDLPKKSAEQKQIDKAAGLRLVHDEVSAEEGLKLALAARTAIIQNIHNSEMEQALGFNNQPVGVDELEAVLQLVNSAIVK